MFVGAGPGLLTICPAPITPNFLISEPTAGVEENWRERDASLCEATLDLEDAMILGDKRARDAMGKGRGKRNGGLSKGNRSGGNNEGTRQTNYFMMRFQ